MSKSVQENKAQIVDFIITTILTTGREPTIKEIVSAGEISRRTFFNYYRNKEKLFLDVSAALKRHLIERYNGDEELKGDSFAEAISYAINKRADMYEYVSPVKKLMEAKRVEGGKIPNLAVSNTQEDMQRLEQNISRFLDHPNGSELLETIYACISWQMWNFYRQELGKGVEESKSLMLKLILAAYNSVAAVRNS